jgi:hypothetical protein
VILAENLLSIVQKTEMVLKKDKKLARLEKIQERRLYLDRRKVGYWVIISERKT